MGLSSQEYQLIALDNEVRCKIAPSAIHGLGVFAMRDIAKGQKCYCVPPFLKSGTCKWYSLSYKQLDKLRPEVRELILQRWPSIINGSRFISPSDMVWLLTYINHSDNPNYDVGSDTAIRDVKAGEEIVQDYRKMTNYQQIYLWLKE